MSDVYSRLVLQALRCVASGVGGKLLGTPAEKSNTAPVADTYKKGQIQGKSFDTRKDPTAASVLIAKLDFVRSPAEDLAQFLTIKQHIC
jgi:hypothetical protein